MANECVITGSHSGHLEEEILSLRNTLLQTELERERIALELEGEKKAQAEWEKRVQEQAKKIENLSTMVLYSSRDENRDRNKKDKRRDTWCPGNLSQEVLREASSTIPSKASDVQTRAKRDMGPLLPFEELVDEIEVAVDDSCKQYDDSTNTALEGCSLPEPCALLHVTNRRKVPLRKKSLPMVIADWWIWMEFGGMRRIPSLQEQLYEELLSAQEEAKMAREQVTSNQSDRTGEGSSDFLVKLSLEVQELMLEVQNSTEVVESVFPLVDEVSENSSALADVFLDFKNLISQSSLQQNSIISNYEKLTSGMREKVSKLEDEKLLFYNQAVDIEKQMQKLRLDAQNSEMSLTKLLEEQDLEKSDFLSQIQALEKEISSLLSSSLAKDKENLRRDLEKTKAKLKETEFKLKNAIQEKTKLEGEKASAEREIKRLLGQNSLLERDISKRNSLAGRRRDSVIDRNSMVFDTKMAKGLAVPFERTSQEGNKKLEVLAFEYETAIASLEEELAAAYREKEEVIFRNEVMASEIEALSEQLDISNKDMNVLQEEVSVLRQCVEESKSNQQKVENSLKRLLDEKEELAMQLSDSLLEMEEERAIWSTKERASIKAIEEKGKLYNAEIMMLSKEMTEVRNELESCQEECRVLRERFSAETAEWQKKCRQEKSLEIDQLKIDRKAVEKKQSQEMLKLDSEMLTECNTCEDVQLFKKELSFFHKEREDLLIRAKDFDTGPELSKNFQNLEHQLLIMMNERDKLMSQIEEQQSHVVETEFLKKHCNDILSEAKVQVEQLTSRISSMEVKMHNDEVENNKEKAKVRMRLRGTQAKLDAFRNRYREAVEESDLMNKKYEEAAGKLKDRLASKGIEVLNLKKQLAAALGQ
ncbi:hypothetical protein CJ030_MR2G023440 [Morella rubra]|uniref:Uncharacterized protein n=1 Tax=Morella rubra TaxID=262757 RepID=A0A6A1WAD3_9ROSI|nr:hypothetical protein CJ030_MR2G023440 [Morella rubra]